MPNFGILAPLQAQNRVISQPSSGGGEDDVLGGLSSLISGFAGKLGSGEGGTVQAAEAPQMNTPVLQGYSNQAVSGSIGNTDYGNQNPLNTQSKLGQIYQSTPIGQDLQLSPAFQSGIRAYNNAKQQGLTKSPYATIVDFSKPADSKRLWVVDTRNNQIVYNTQVSQGAPGFSNTPGSHQSSLGTFVTGSVYNGKHGPSLRVQGLDKGINDNAYSRDITVHGSNYAASGGQSWGCFAVPQQDAEQLAKLMQGGSVIHAYGPGSPASNPNQNNFISNPNLGKQVLSQPGNNPFNVPSNSNGSNMSNYNQQTLDTLKQFEGFSSTPYWDVNAHRIGYGSDTITRSDGSIVRVQPGMSVTKEDADRDLSRRSKEFENTATKQVGTDIWSNLPDNAKPALISMTYNYGSLPKDVVGAVKSGDVNAISSAVRSHQWDNNGVNKVRRNKEADMIQNNGITNRSFKQAFNSNPVQKYIDPTEINPPAIPHEQYEDMVRKIDKGSDYSQLNKPNNLSQMYGNNVETIDEHRQTLEDRIAQAKDPTSKTRLEDAYTPKVFKNIPTISELTNEVFTHNLTNPLDIAKKYVGLTTSNPEHTNIISEVIKKGAGNDVNPLMAGYCGTFVDSILRLSGRAGNNTNSREEWDNNFGPDVLNPSKGDLVLTNGHVGFYAGPAPGKPGYIRVLGGNQISDVPGLIPGDTKGKGYEGINIATMPKNMVFSYKHVPEGRQLISITQRLQNMMGN